MDSQEWAAEFPKISVSLAKKILASHGFDDVDEDLIDENDEVSSQQLVNWLGY